MSLELVDLILTSLVAMIALVGGWWLGFCHGRGAHRQVEDESERVREVLARLYSLANRMAADVGAHSSRIEEINQELTGAAMPDPEAVIQAVARLVEANQATQGQLLSAEQKLQEQAQEIQFHATEARTDALTLLANRRALDDDLARRVAEADRLGRPLSVMMIDVDHFKKFNDTYGHLAGDEVLRGLGRVFRRTTRQMDLVARYGGEEFAVILPETPIGEAERVALRTREAIAKACVSFEGQDLKVTASIGLAERLPGEDGPALIKRADEALYAAKEAGRNCVHLHDGRTTRPVGGNNETRIVQPNTEPPAGALSSPSPPNTKPSSAGPTGESPKKLIIPNPIPGADFVGRSLDRSAFCQIVRHRVAEWKRCGPSLSVLLVEVDRYEQIMLGYDPPAGELVMCTVAQSLKRIVRAMDVVTRYGPDCFGLLLPGADLSSAIGLAERLRQAVAKETLGEDGQLRLTVSIGVAEVTERDDMVSLLQRAEAAVGAGLQHGGNTVYHHDGRRAAPISALVEAVGYLTEPAGHPTC